MDVLADAQRRPDESRRPFRRRSASEAAAAAMLVGLGDVSDARRGHLEIDRRHQCRLATRSSNLASGGVTGGALIIIGEDYGEGSSIMQERSHAFAMKSQIWLLDPRPNLPSIVNTVEDGFELSEASNTPVMLRGPHPHLPCARPVRRQGQQAPAVHAAPGAGKSAARYQPHRAAARPFLHEKEKLEKRWPAAVEFIKQRKLNEYFGPAEGDVGIILQGGMYNGVMRALQHLGLADVYGESTVPLYVMNVTYPLIDDEIADVLRRQESRADGRGRPARIYRAGAQHASCAVATSTTKLHGKDVLPMGGEYTAPVLVKGIEDFFENHARARARQPAAAAGSTPTARRSEGQGARRGRAAAPGRVLHRLSGAADLRGDEAGREASSASTTSRPISAATCSRSCRRSISAPPRWATAWGRPRPRPSTSRPTSGRSRSWAMAASGTTG